MDEDDKDKIVKDDGKKIDETQSEGEKHPSDEPKSINDPKPTISGQESSEISKNEEKKEEHRVIHKKDGRLHVYVRQDKYKGELKSKNWVGRLFIDGKQKISSSGTSNLEEAIPILEKWFDDIHSQKEKEKQNLEQPATSKQSTPTPEQPTTPSEEPSSIMKETPKSTVVNQNIDSKPEKIETTLSIVEKLRNIKFSKPSFGKMGQSSGITKDVRKNKFFQNAKRFLTSKVSKASISGEEIVGVEITPKEIRIAQISSNRSNQWILEKFYIHPIQLPEDAQILDHTDKLGDELSIALQKTKITTFNAAIAIPVTSAIIRVVTAPLMTDEELGKAIDTNSLWENLVQLTDNLDDYSVFHQVINRNQKDNTMDILFVASKLSEVNNYTSIIKKSGLNPVIIDVKCFAVKSAVDQINQISKGLDDKNLTAVLEFGLDENYLMILYKNNPIITDIFLRSQDRKILLESKDINEKEAVIRRYTTQVKQAVADFETKYEKRIRNIKVVSNLPNIREHLGNFRKLLVNVGINLFDPLNGLKIPKQVEQLVNLPNRSYLSTTIGLAFRKLDVFGYYKFVTAVKNINLLPNRQNMIKQKKFKAFSNFAFKGAIATVAIIYVLLFGLSFWNINSYNKKLVNYDKIVSNHALKSKQKAAVAKELGAMTKALKLSKTIKSNKDLSYRILAQVASSVPKRVRFTKIDYNGSDRIQLTGFAASDQDILKLIANLSKQKLIRQASLSSMKLPTRKAGQQSTKGFRIICKVGRKV